MEDLELELVLAVKVPASSVRPSDLEKVDGKHAVDELELDLLLEVLLPQLKVSSLVFEEEQPHKRYVVGQLFHFDNISQSHLGAL